MSDKQPSKFFAFLSRMKYINRWSLMRNTTTENIAEHSLYVSLIAHALSVIDNKFFGGNNDVYKIGMAAAYHDVGEVITGDVPTPIKYFSSEMRTAYKTIERNADKKIFSTLPDELKDDFDVFLNLDKKEVQIIKYADKLTAYIKCIEESTLNNSEFKSAMITIEKDLKDYDSKAVDYFIETFIDAYKLTLDQLSE